MRVGQVHLPDGLAQTVTKGARLGYKTLHQLCIEDVKRVYRLDDVGGDLGTGRGAALV